MISVSQLRRFIVRPTLEHIGLWSHNAEQLVICTGLQESHLRFVDQLDRGGSWWGPALGFFQMEKATHTDHWRWLESRTELRDKVKSLMGEHPEPWRQLAGNVNYAAAMCRIHYRTKPGALPSGDDLEAMGRYWKKFYNTVHGKGTVEQFVASCRDHWKEGL
jgi:hypothetical protein